MSGDPRTYDYSQPTRLCDVVMKGGITSGVVYPHALCEIARTYRFVNVGGTSAGAIAAAAAAAAEHGRERGGFEKLARLPDWVGAGENLFRLFQPQPATRPFYRVLTAGLGRTGAGKWLHGSVRAPALPAHGGRGPRARDRGRRARGGRRLRRPPCRLDGRRDRARGARARLGARAPVLLGLPAALAGTSSASAAGFRPTRGTRPALTTWLSDLVDDLAGKAGGGPLTFGDLRARGVDFR